MNLCTDNLPHVMVGPNGPCSRCGKSYNDCHAVPAPHEPSPYEQGFRDALLTVRALTLVHNGVNGMGSLGLKLDDFIDQANHDLWKLFAVAQADLSAYPEAQTLRSMLRAPSGVLIDSEGRMLFLRLNGTEYDTGVLALLEENAKLGTALQEHVNEMREILAMKVTVGPPGKVPGTPEYDGP